MASIAALGTLDMSSSGLSKVRSMFIASIAAVSSSRSISPLWSLSTCVVCGVQIVVFVLRVDGKGTCAHVRVEMCGVCCEVCDKCVNAKPCMSIHARDVVEETISSFRFVHTLLHGH